jgi:O-antigen/teichoic acid export membrane protein
VTAVARRWQSTIDLAGRMRRNEAFVRIAANTSWLLGDRLVRAALGFLVGAWVARHLGPERFGHYAYVLTFIAFFQAVANLGADSIVVRDIARDPDAAPTALGAALRLRVVSGLACWVVAVALTAAINPAAHETILMTAIVGGVMVFQAVDTIDLWFQSQTQSRRTVVAKLTALVATSGFKIVLILLDAPLPWFAAAFLFDFAAAALALGFAYRRFRTPAPWRYERQVARALLAQSWPFMLSALSITVYMRIDQIMLKAFSGAHEVGVFAAALPLSQIWQMLPMTLVVSFAPFIAKKRLIGADAYDSALLMVFRLFGVLALAVSLLTALLAPVIVPLIYGAQFMESVTILQIHVFTNVFLALGLAQGLWIANEGVGHILLKQTVVGAVVAVTANAVLIPRFGAIGAACAAVLAQACAAWAINTVLAPRIFLMQIGINPSRLKP